MSVTHGAILVDAIYALRGVADMVFSEFCNLATSLSDCKSQTARALREIGSLVIIIESNNKSMKKKRNILSMSGRKIWGVN